MNTKNLYFIQEKRKRKGINNEVVFMKIFMVIGIVTTVVLLILILRIIFKQIQYKLKHKTKLEFLCHHMYELNSIWANKEMGLMCKKCGKRKFIDADIDSFIKFFKK